jgi:hypothetical protein
LWNLKDFVFYGFFFVSEQRGVENSTGMSYCKMKDKESLDYPHAAQELDSPIFLGLADLTKHFRLVHFTTDDPH